MINIILVQSTPVLHAFIHMILEGYRFVSYNSHYKVTLLNRTPIRRYLGYGPTNTAFVLTLPPLPMDYGHKLIS
jgi:hypothetical protein